MKKIFLLLVLLLILLFFNKKILIEKFSYNNIFNTEFDKIIYINLDHRKDRKEQILNEFKKMNIDETKIHRIHAVHEKYNGHIGCAKSHIKAIEYAKNNGFKRVLIFEDDFVFLHNEDIVKERIQNFLRNTPKWDVCQFTSVYVTYKNNDENNNVRLVNKASTSSCYAINSTFYDKLLNNLNDSLKKMEHEMEQFNKNNNNILKKKHTSNYALDQNWYKLQEKSNWYIFYPFLGKQGGEAAKSSIMSSNLEGFTNFFF